MKHCNIVERGGWTNHKNRVCIESIRHNSYQSCTSSPRLFVLSLVYSHSSTPYTHLLPKLIHKTLMKVRHFPHPLRPRSQERSPEMQRARLLSKARARDHADARRVQQAEAVELVGLASFLLGLLLGLFRDGDGWEEVHRALRAKGISPGNRKNGHQSEYDLPEDPGTRRPPSF